MGEGLKRLFLKVHSLFWMHFLCIPQMPPPTAHSRVLDQLTLSPLTTTMPKKKKSFVPESIVLTGEELVGVGTGVVAMEVEETLGVGVSPRQSLGGVAWSFTRFAVCVWGGGGGKGTLVIQRYILYC